MKRTKFKLIPTTCPRCKKEVYTGNRSLYGADQARAKYKGICSDCITPEEHAEIEKAVTAAVLNTITH